MAHYDIDIECRVCGKYLYSKFELSAEDLTATCPSCKRKRNDLSGLYRDLETLRRKGGDRMAMSMSQALAHTRMRFDTMRPVALWTRMGKIADQNKLEAFAVVAEERGMLDLATAARARLSVMRGGNPIKEVKISTKREESSLKSMPAEKLKRRIDL